jgi:hypothetical protein
LDGLVIFIDTHVESLEDLRVVVDNDWALHHLFADVTFVLAV